MQATRETKSKESSNKQKNVSSGHSLIKKLVKPIDISFEVKDDQDAAANDKQFQETGNGILDEESMLLIFTTEPKRNGKGGVITPFPLKLHNMLSQIEDDGLSSVISWQPHGRAFVVRNPAEFSKRVMPKYFKQTKFASFQRQLNLYGFRRITSGRDKGGYYHKLFVRGCRSLCQHMLRIKIKGTKVRKATCPEADPDFYSATHPFSLPNQTKKEQHRCFVIDSTTKKRKSEAIPSQKPLFQQSEMPTTEYKTSPESSEYATFCPELTQDEKKKLTTDCTKQRNPKNYPINQILESEGLLSCHHKKEEESNSDVLFFEGKPFHYLDKIKPLPVLSKRPAHEIPSSFYTIDGGGHQKRSQK